MRKTDNPDPPTQDRDDATGSKTTLSGEGDALGPEHARRENSFDTSRPAQSSGAALGLEPAFDRPVGPNGYAWWYIDALSHDRRHGLTIIAMIGSVFSPYYAWARKRGPTDPEEFCALNVALYGASGKRWGLTERGAAALQRTPEQLLIGPSSVRWNGRWLEVNIDEITVPLPSRLRGQVRLHPSSLSSQSYSLDRSGQHHWWPVAPCSRVEVDMQRPKLRWSGDAYFDANAGSEPLENRFVSWNWSRAALADGGAAILYDKVIRGEPARSLALHVDRDGHISAFPAPPNTSLPKTRVWRIERGIQVESGREAQVQRTLEDTPFYARSVVSSHILGQAVTAMHESLSLERFSQPWVRLLLPFRMPRVTRAYPR